MNSNKGVVAQFTDRMGETRTIHRGSWGALAVKRESITPALAMNQAVTAMIGERVRGRRKAIGMSMSDLAVRCGMGAGSPKQRIWAIENATRQNGVRIGTLYALAAALGCQVSDFLPSVEEVIHAANVKGVQMVVLAP